MDRSIFEEARLLAESGRDVEILKKKNNARKAAKPQMQYEKTGCVRP